MKLSIIFAFQALVATAVIELHRAAVVLTTTRWQSLELAFRSRILQHAHFLVNTPSF